MSEAVIVVMVDAKAAVNSTILVLSKGLQTECYAGNEVDHELAHFPFDQTLLKAMVWVSGTLHVTQFLRHDQALILSYQNRV